MIIIPLNREQYCCTAKTNTQSLGLNQSCILTGCGAGTAGCDKLMVKLFASFILSGGEQWKDVRICKVSSTEKRSDDDSITVVLVSRVQDQHGVKPAVNSDPVKSTVPRQFPEMGTVRTIIWAI